MRNNLVLLVSLFAFSCHALAKEYGHYDPMKILTVTKSSNGEQYGLDLLYIDRVIRDLSIHAGRYPTRFDSDDDKQRARNDVRVISGMLDVVVEDPGVGGDLLKRSSILNSIGKNLDVPGTAKRADRDFRNLLRRYPDDPHSNYLYGSFLGGSNKTNEAIPYLKRAVELGIADAYFALGMAYVMKKDDKAAISYFEEYKEHKPDGRDVTGIIKAIRSGNI